MQNGLQVFFEDYWKDEKRKQYCAEEILKDLVSIVVESYIETGELKLTAEELSISALKVRKLLITAEEYHNSISDQINKLYSEGKSLTEIQQIMGLGRSSVNGYLPYTKVVYKPKEISLNAKRISVYRKRQAANSALLDTLSEESLWDVIVEYQEYPSHTMSGLSFMYMLKKGKDEASNRELIISRRTGSKTLTWSSMMLTFNKALKMRGQMIERPKTLGDIRGVSYVYPMLYRFGIISVPEGIAEKMQLKSKASI